jgi:hypothetical protein
MIGPLPARREAIFSAPSAVAVAGGITVFSGASATVIDGKDGIDREGGPGFMVMTKCL